MAGRLEMNGLLFPGNSQHKRFMDGLSKILKEQENELRQMGYVSHTEISSHSIRKGATKSLIEQLISICIRGGWPLGGGNDVLMTCKAESIQFLSTGQL